MIYWYSVLERVFWKGFRTYGNAWMGKVAKVWDYHLTEKSDKAKGIGSCRDRRRNAVNECIDGAIIEDWT